MLLLVFIISISSIVFGKPGQDTLSAPISIEQMDKKFDSLQKASDAIGDKIKETERKIEAAKEKKGRKPNYVWPILGGALIGIGLALWLRRKK